MKHLDHCSSIYHWQMMSNLLLIHHCPNLFDRRDNHCMDLDQMLFVGYSHSSSNRMDQSNRFMENTRKKRNQCWIIKRRLNSSSLLAEGKVVWMYHYYSQDINETERTKNSYEGTIASSEKRKEDVAKDKSSLIILSFLSYIDYLLYCVSYPRLSRSAQPLIYRQDNMKMISSYFTFVSRQNMDEQRKKQHLIDIHILLLELVDMKYRSI